MHVSRIHRAARVSKRFRSRHPLRSCPCAAIASPPNSKPSKRSKSCTYPRIHRAARVSKRFRSRHPLDPARAPPSLRRPIPNHPNGANHARIAIHRAARVSKRFRSRHPLILPVRRHRFAAQFQAIQTEQIMHVSRIHRAARVSKRFRSRHPLDPARAPPSLRRPIPNHPNGANHARIANSPSRARKQAFSGSTPARSCPCAAIASPPNSKPSKPSKSCTYPATD